MRCGIAIVATVAVAVLGIGCGNSGQADAQAQTLAYQSEIGRINQVFVGAPVSPRSAQALLQRAIVRYGDLRPPARLRALHARLLAELRGELRALRAARRAVNTGEASGLRAAVAVHTKWQRAVSRTLARITATVNACRGDATRC